MRYTEIYTQKKLDKLDKELGTQDYDDFIKKIKTTFSDKTKEADYYELKPLELDKRTNSCIRVNTRELDRDSFTNWSTFYTTTDDLCSLLCTLP